MLCLRTTLRKYNVGGYSSGTYIVMYLRPFVLIAYICGYTKVQENDRIHQRSTDLSKNHDVL